MSFQKREEGGDLLTEVDVLQRKEGWDVALYIDVTLTVRGVLVVVDDTRRSCDWRRWCDRRLDVCASMSAHCGARRILGHVPRCSRTRLDLAFKPAFFALPFLPRGRVGSMSFAASGGLLPSPLGSCAAYGKVAMVGGYCELVSTGGRGGGMYSAGNGVPG